MISSNLFFLKVSFSSLTLTLSRKSNTSFFASAKIDKDWNGDCFGDENWSDCDNDRQRIELSSEPNQPISGTQCYGYSIKLSKNFIPTLKSSIWLNHWILKLAPCETPFPFKLAYRISFELVS